MLFFFCSSNFSLQKYFYIEENPEETSSDAMKKLADIYPDKSQSELHSALTITNGNAEEAVHLLLDVEDTKPNHRRPNSVYSFIEISSER